MALSRDTTWWLGRFQPQIAGDRPAGARRTAATLYKAASVRFRRPDRESRRTAKASLGDLTPGEVTVAIVTFHTLPFLKTAVEMVRRHTPGVRIMVLDNASTDGTREWLAAQPDIVAVVLPKNIGHGAAVDQAFLRATTEYVAVLDVDAYPISPDWLDLPRRALEDGATVAGAESGKAPTWPHPCYLMMRTERFVTRNHTFRTSLSWDVGQLVAMREFGTYKVIPRSETLGPDYLGAVFGGLVFHNYYSRVFSPATGMTDAQRKEQALGTWLRAAERWGVPVDASFATEA